MPKVQGHTTTFSPWHLMPKWPLLVAFSAFQASIKIFDHLFASLLVQVVREETHMMTSTPPLLHMGPNFPWPLLHARVRVALFHFNILLKLFFSLSFSPLNYFHYPTPSLALSLKNQKASLPFGGFWAPLTHTLSHTLYTKIDSKFKLHSSSQRAYIIFPPHSLLFYL